MRRVLLLATLIAFAAVPRSFAGAWLKTAAAAEKAAREKKQMIFVDLFAQWCGWCHKFESDVVPAEVFQKATANMVLLRLDTEDGADGTKFARKYQIQSLPTFVVLNPDMTIVGLIRGYAPAAEFVKMLDGTIQSYRNFKKLAAAESTFLTDYDKRSVIAREFMNRLNFAESEPRFKKLMTEKGVPVAYRDQAYYSLAAGYLMQGKFSEVTRTLDDFGKVQSQGETYERARLLASDVCIAQGNLRCAADELKKFKKQFPSSPMIPNVDMILPSIERQLNPPSPGTPVKQQ